MADESPIAFSRTVETGPLGKLDQERKTHLDEATNNKFLQISARLDMTPSQLQREVLYLVVHGVTFTEFCAKHRSDAMAREGLNQGQFLNALDRLDQGRGRAAS